MSLAVDVCYVAEQNAKAIQASLLCIVDFVQCAMKCILKEVGHDHAMNSYRFQVRLKCGNHLPTLPKIQGSKELRK